MANVLPLRYHSHSALIFLEHEKQMNKKNIGGNMHIGIVAGN